jgi:hypothetical protein
MSTIAKGKSPFYPGQPVPVELFVGRAAQIDRIMTRGVGQVAQGKPVSMFVQGDYGIGKSSIAAFAQWLAEKDHGLHGIYVSLGGARSLNDVAASILEGTLRSGALNRTKGEKIRSWLGKYIEKLELFGFTLDFAKLQQDAPQLASPSGLLAFLGEVRTRLDDAGVKGLFLVLDEINGIAANGDFSHFLKGLVDTNGMSPKPVPLLLMLCGVEERRRQMIQNHQPVDRIFDVVDIEGLSKGEMEEFFKRAFTSVQRTVQNGALHTLIHYSAGFPKIMHLVGDAAYWIDQDGLIDGKDAGAAVSWRRKRSARNTSTSRSTAPWEARTTDRSSRKSRRWARMS